MVTFVAVVIADEVGFSRRWGAASRSDEWRGNGIGGKEGHASPVWERVADTRSPRPAGERVGTDIDRGGLRGEWDTERGRGTMTNGECEERRPPSDEDARTGRMKSGDEHWAPLSHEEKTRHDVLFFSQRPIEGLLTGERYWMIDHDHPATVCQLSIVPCVLDIMDIIMLNRWRVRSIFSISWAHD